MTTTWIDRPPPKRRRESRLAAWAWAHTRDLHYGTIAGLIITFVMMIFTLTRIRWGAFGAPSLDSAFLPWVGWLLVVPAWVGGAMNRGRAHAKGIRHSHFHAIKGKSLAVGLILLAVLLIAGGG